MQKKLRRKKWKEHTNLKKDKDKKFMASVKEWRHKVEDKLWRDVETEVENTSPLKDEYGSQT